MNLNMYLSKKIFNSIHFKGIFVAGKPYYRIQKPSGNMVVTVSKCIGVSVQQH